MKDRLRPLWTVIVGRAIGLLGAGVAGIGCLIIVFSGGSTTLVATMGIGSVLIALGLYNLFVWRLLEKPLNPTSLTFFCGLLVVDGYPFRLIRWEYPWSWMYHGALPLVVLLIASGILYLFLRRYFRFGICRPASVPIKGAGLARDPEPADIEERPSS
jgi:hypothetical protein